MSLSRTAEFVIVALASVLSLSCTSVSPSLAWISLYEKQGKEWRRVGNVSNFKE